MEKNIAVVRLGSTSYIGQVRADATAEDLISNLQAKGFISLERPCMLSQITVPVRGQLTNTTNFQTLWNLDPLPDTCPVLLSTAGDVAIQVFLPSDSSHSLLSLYRKLLTEVNPKNNSKLIA